jgi:uncharacterized protein YjbI with pentapeptide repeats
METRQTIELNQVDQRLEVTQSCLSGSTFNDVNLSESTFDNVNLSRAKIQNATLAGSSIQDASLAGLKITNADLRNAAISDCLIDGMTIEGVAVTEMMAAYRASKA